MVPETFSPQRLVATAPLLGAGAEDSPVGGRLGTKSPLGDPSASDRGTNAVSALTQAIPLLGGAERMTGLHDEAMLAAREGRFGSAETALADMVLIAEGHQWRDWEMLGWALLGELHGSRGRLLDAVSAYRTALDVGKLGHNVPSELSYKCWNNLGCLLKQGDELGESEEQFVQAVNALEQQAPSRWLHRSMLYNNLGALYHTAGYFGEALEMHERALEYCGQLQTAPARLKAELHRNAALARYFANEADQAVGHFEQARQHTQLAAMDQYLASELLVELSLAESCAHMASKNYSQAEKRLLEAITECQRHGGRVTSMLPIIYTNLAVTYARAGLPLPARDLMEDAHLMRLSNLSTPTVDLAQSHWNLALLNHWLEDAPEASRHLQRWQNHVQRRITLPVRPIDGWATSGPEVIAQQLSLCDVQAIQPLTTRAFGAKPGGLERLKMQGLRS
jgi:tetratricopeptide (TPR) repeat protein